MIILIMYIAIFVGAFLVVSYFQRGQEKKGFNSLKTVTFGDESAVSPNRAAAIISVVTIFLIWGAFTDSKLVPLHVPGPFVGDTSFTYTAKNAAGETDEGEVKILVHRIGEKPEKPEVTVLSALKPLSSRPRWRYETTRKAPTKIAMYMVNIIMRLPPHVP